MKKEGRFRLMAQVSGGLVVSLHLPLEYHLLWLRCLEIQGYQMQRYMKNYGGCARQASKKCLKLLQCHNCPSMKRQQDAFVQVSNGWLK